MRTKTLTIQIFILFLVSTLLFAQSRKEMKEKLNNIKGDVSKIVISTENGEVTFEGDEAEKLFKKMKSKTIHKNIEWISKDENDFEFDFESNNVLIFESDKGGKHIIKEFKDADNVMIIKTDSDQDIEVVDGNQIIQIEVEEENGEKIITVTTEEDGEEKVKTYNGKEADEYLEKMEDEHQMIIDVNIDTDKNHHTHKMWIHSDDDHNKIEDKVQVEVEDGKKTVTITTTKDGKEKVKILEGEEAEKYINEHEGNDKKIRIKKIKSGDKTIERIIIKEIKKEED